MSAAVTKRHRELAYTAARDLAVPPEGSPAERWVDTGAGEPPGVWLRIAEALADIEAAAKRRTDGVVCPHLFCSDCARNAIEGYDFVSGQEEPKEHQ